MLRPSLFFSTSKVTNIGFGIYLIDEIQVCSTNGRWSYNVQGPKFKEVSLNVIMLKVIKFTRLRHTRRKRGQTLRSGRIGMLKSGRLCVAGNYSETGDDEEEITVVLKIEGKACNFFMLSNFWVAEFQKVK